MEIHGIPEPRLEECFRVEVTVEKPIVAGHDGVHGRRQLVRITGGTVSGELVGSVLPGGVDSQIIRPDGFTQVSARYALELTGGKTVYIENNGMRSVAPGFEAEAAAGKIIDPNHVYFAAVPRFEVYDESLRWLERSVFICRAARLPDNVLLRFYKVL